MASAVTARVTRPGLVLESVEAHEGSSPGAGPAGNSCPGGTPSAALQARPPPVVSSATPPSRRPPCHQAAESLR
jgi:hypothetical protein